MKKPNRKTHVVRRARPPTPPQISLNRRERATIVAALRFHQDENLQGQRAIADLAIREIATDSGTIKALSSREIDALCTKLHANP